MIHVRQCGQTFFIDDTVWAHSEPVCVYSVKLELKVSCNSPRGRLELRPIKANAASGQGKSGQEQPLSVGFV